jgi:predicted nucleic acid-binding Zn ribbon protein
VERNTKGDNVVKDMKDIRECVICGKRLAPDRPHVDTCSEAHYKALLVRQRARNAAIDAAGDE